MFAEQPDDAGIDQKSDGYDDCEARQRTSMGLYAAECEPIVQIIVEQRAYDITARRCDYRISPKQAHHENQHGILRRGGEHSDNDELLELNKPGHEALNLLRRPQPISTCSRVTIDQIARSTLGLDVDFPDILAENAEAEDLDAA